MVVAMVRRRAISALVCVVLALGGFYAGSAATASGPKTVSKTTASQQTPAKCKRCKRIIRKARKCRAENDTSDRCKRLKRKARKCRRTLKSDACKPKPSPSPSTEPSPSASASASPGAGDCEPYVPGEAGAEAETVVVVDANTEEAPQELSFEMPPAPNPVPGTSESVFVNLQVDTDLPEAGLFARFEYAEGEDFDIYLTDAEGNHQAGAAGGNPVDVQGDSTHGGHTEVTAEQLDGIGTPDCGGYTLEMRSFATPGGDYSLKVWLGEKGCDPPCGDPYE